MSVDTGIGALDGRCIGVRRSLYEGRTCGDLISIELGRLPEQRVLSVGARSSCVLRGVMRRVENNAPVGPVALNRVFNLERGAERARIAVIDLRALAWIRSDSTRPAEPGAGR